MNLYELVKYLRVSLLDDVGGHNIDWSTIDEGTDESIMLRWSNEELTQFINEALVKVATGTGVLYDIEPKFQLALVPGTFVYDLDPRIIRIKNTKLGSSGLPLEEIDLADIEDVSNWSDILSTPSSYVVDYEMGKIAMFPNPAEDDTLQIWAIRTEMNKLDWKKSDKCKPEVPERWHIPMLYYAAHLCYLKDEANSLDPQMADKFLARFMNEFDFNSAYVQKRRSTSRGRTVKYGGI